MAWHMVKKDFTKRLVLQRKSHGLNSLELVDTVKFTLWYQVIQTAISLQDFKVKFSFGQDDC
jgi:hypothetical protein